MLVSVLWQVKESFLPHPLQMHFSSVRTARVRRVLFFGKKKYFFLQKKVTFFCKKKYFCLQKKVTFFYKKKYFSLQKKVTIFKQKILFGAIILLFYQSF